MKYNLPVIIVTKPQVSTSFVSESAVTDRSGRDTDCVSLASLTTCSVNVYVAQGLGRNNTSSARPFNFLLVNFKLNILYRNFTYV